MGGYRTAAACGTARAKGGRPPLPHRAALTGILFVLKSGVPWEMLPQEMGCGSGMTCWRRLRDWQAAGIWHRLHGVLLDRLGGAHALDGSRACVDSASVPAKGGREDRPQSDRPRPRRVQAPRHHAHGVPLAFRITAANVHDSRLFEELIDAVPPVRQGRGRPCRRPAKRHADKAYDLPRCRRALRKRRIGNRIARRGIESSEPVGRRRWVAERTLAWFSRFRRLTLRCERRADLFEAFHHPAATLISWRFVQRGFC